MTIIQKPNTPALVTAIGFMISLFTSGGLLFISMCVFASAGIYWSYIEITSGVNSFRKGLGWIGLLSILLYFYYRIIEIKL